MKQYEAVIQTLERLGGQATLADLYREAMKVKDCKWGTKTPFASIRRIVQVRPEFVKIRPGLWALRSYQAKLGLIDQDGKGQATSEAIEQTHAYYQGLLVEIGNLRGFDTFVPNQDKNKKFISKPRGEMRTLQELPPFSYSDLVRRGGTVDVTWFNHRRMPNSFFEVEHSTDIQGSLVKFCDLQDFHARMIVVADESRRAEFEHKQRLTAFDTIQGRVSFLDYNMLVKNFEYEKLRAIHKFAL
ncbi:MAG: hypothetical protein FJ011_05615 [Chloroflexi bacterium]|nr:hypothetical protein [Chloroflexota bacterium]